MEQLVKELEAKMAEFAKNAADQVEKATKLLVHALAKHH